MTISIERFIKAQESTYEIAMRELANSRKKTHWMWYVFPQLRGLGSSEESLFYGIQNLAEARNYLAHPVLSSRLKAATQAVLSSRVAPTKILGEIDAIKFASCMTLFAAASEEGSIYAEALKSGVRADLKTLKLLKKSGENHE